MKKKNRIYQNDTPHAKNLKRETKSRRKVGTYRKSVRNREVVST